MSQRQLDVLLGETLVGHLRYTHEGRREHASFQYADSWLRSPDRHEIDPTLPLVSGPQYPAHSRTPGTSRFHAAIADTEPDGWARRVILRDHAKRRHVAKEQGVDLPPLLSDLDFLLAVDDHARVGALRFRDQDGVCQRTVEPGRRSAPPLLELPDLLRATQAVERQNETLADLEYLRGRATSLGGMRPKCTVRDDDWGLCLGKFPSVSDERSYTKGEVLALHLARQAGINAAEARLVDSDGLPVALVRRFDRIRDPNTGEERRLFYVSAATMLGVAPGDTGEHSYTEIADVIRQRSADAAADLEELWRRIAFSIMINNVDDHLHNHGFLHVAGDLWRLSPAFDLNPFPDRARELKTWISEDVGPEASMNSLLSTASHFGLSKTDAETIKESLRECISDWKRVARELGFSASETASFADAFAQHDT